MKHWALVATLIVLLCLAAGPARSDWRFYFLDNFFVAGADSDPHPESLRVVVASTPPANLLATIVCGDYFNNFEQRNKGRYVMRGEVLRGDGSTESFKGRSGIRRNEGSVCLTLEPTGEDDLITVSYEFESFPALTREGGNDEDPDRFLMSTFVIPHSAGPGVSTARRIASHRAAARRRFEEGKL